MQLTDFDYDLPEHYIAQTPLEKRDHSKLLAYDRATEKTEIRQFFDILDYLRKGDVLVINNTRVIPARLFGTKENSGAKIELLLLKDLGDNIWECLVKPLKRVKINENVVFDKLPRPLRGHPFTSEGEFLTAKLISKNEVAGTAKLAFSAGPQPYGETPLPQYIHQKIHDSERYQTVYNRIAGSVAAPTAGLHWTPELMQSARNKGVIFTEVLLHVGLGTFRPVKVDNIQEHIMHSEYYEIPPVAQKEIALAKKEKRRVICVGTTSMRALESYALTGKTTGETDIFIYPPFDFRVANALITNFHLPKSTLLMLVAAFIGACHNEEKTTPPQAVPPFTSEGELFRLYTLAKNNNFRFFSFGDCMFIS